jgi:hypothetical protein
MLADRDFWSAVSERVAAISISGAAFTVVTVGNRLRNCITLYQAPQRIGGAFLDAKAPTASMGRSMR